MSVVYSARKTSDGIENFVSKSLVTYSELENVRKKKSLINTVELTKQQENEIDSFFKKHYGKKIKYSWHRLYQSYTGVFRFNYFPEILFPTKLEPLLNSYHAGGYWEFIYRIHSCRLSMDFYAMV